MPVSLTLDDSAVADIAEGLWHTPARRILERERKREALLQAAVEMFNERGFHNTSLDDIATRLGVTKPVIYHYLGNKDQVLFHCVRQGLDLLRDAADGSGDAGDGLTRLRLFLVRYAEIIMSDFGRCVIRTDDTLLASDSRARFRAMKRDIDTILRARVAAAMDDGSISVRDPRTTAFALAGALNWLARWHDPAGPSPVGTIAADTVDILIDGLRPPPALSSNG